MRRPPNPAHRLLRSASTPTPQPPVPPTTRTRRADRRQARRRRNLTRISAFTALTLALSAAITLTVRPPEHTISLDIDGVSATHTVRARDVADVLSATGVTISTKDHLAPAADAPVDDGTHIQVRHHHTVQVTIDETERSVPTTAATVGELLDRLGPVADEAQTSAPTHALLRQTRALDIKTRKTVTVTVDGAAQELTTWTATVAAVLAEAGQQINLLDVVEPALDQPLGSTTAIAVTKAFTTHDVETVQLAHNEQVIEDPATPKGATRVVQDGSDGVIERTWAVVSRGGVEVRRDLVEETRTEPVDRVVAVGSKPPPAPAPKQPTSAPQASAASSGDTRALGQAMAAEKGWTGSQWTCLENLWQKESGWKTTAANPNSSAYGIPQALPGSKMASAGADWKTNPATQIAWGLGYIANRYGTPCGAWSHSQAKNWY